MKRWSSRIVVLMVLLLALAVPAIAFGPGNLTIPDSAEAISYGTSGAGRNLLAYRFGTGKNVMVMGFAIHGFEDNWSNDAGALVYTADKLMAELDANQQLINDYGWTVYVLPCMNPDGLLDGYSHNGPGRLTTHYYNASGQLSAAHGIDLNRSFDYRWTQYTGDRNFNGSRPNAAPESEALAGFLKTVKGDGVNLCIDAHGWMSQIITSNGYSKLYDIFKSKFPGNSYASLSGGRGYMASYAAYELGYTGCLFEFPDGLYSQSQFEHSGYAGKYVSCILELAKTYGTYSPYVPPEPDPEPEPEPEPEPDPHLAVCPAKNFTDVNLNAWYHDSLDYVLTNGIFKGMSDTIFAPNDDMTRAMLVTTLWRLDGSPVVEPEETPEEPNQYKPIPDFPDVEKGKWYDQAVKWAVSHSIVQGYPDGTFKPDRAITREEMTVLFQRYVLYIGGDIAQETDLGGYPDNERISAFARPAMSWAVATGLIQGTTSDQGNILVPQGHATRIQVAAVLARFAGEAGRGSVEKPATRNASPVTTAEMEPNIYDPDAPELDN